MARALIILMFLWGISLGGYLLMRRVPKTSPLHGVKELLLMFSWAVTVVVVLMVVALLTGVFTIGDTPFRN